jgi:phosphoribosyl-AMP cyclohydrolase
MVMDFSKLDGLIPAVVQDRTSGEVLMVGFMNDAAWRITLDTGYVTFFSRTRNTLWTKGETSGNRLAVRQIFTDCDDDTVLVKVDREGDGNVCHTGQRSCFYTEVPVASRRSPVPGGADSPETGHRMPDTGEAVDEALESTQPMADGAGATVENPAPGNQQSAADPAAGGGQTADQTPTDAPPTDAGRLPKKDAQ